MTTANGFEVLILSNFRHKLIALFLIINMALLANNAVAQNNSKNKSSIEFKKANENISTTSKMGRKGRRPAPLVIVDTVRQETYSQVIPVIGRFVARRIGVIAAQVNGAIEEFRVNIGDRVQTGDILAVLVKKRLIWQHELKKSQVANQVAALKTKQQELTLLRQELGRLQSLKKSPAFSQARLDDKLQQIAVARSEIVEAEAKLSTAQASRQLTALDLHDAKVRAPHAGVVTKRHTSVGAYVNVGAPVLTLLDDHTMEIEADVPSNRIPDLRKDIKINALINGIESIRAKVRAIIPEENPRTRTRAVRFTPIFDKITTNLIATNQSVVLSVPAGRARSVITVHKDAVINRKGKKIVMLAIDGKAQPRNVILGPPTGSRFVVNRGLKLSDFVVIRGNERLMAGSEIRYKGYKPRTDSKAHVVEDKNK